MSVKPPVTVAVGVIRNSDNQFIIAKRPDGKAHAGCWEFPGGKVRQGETVTQALNRELKEELNLDVVKSRPLIRIRHDYDEYSVILDVHLVYEWAGNPYGREGQSITLSDLSQLAGFIFPAANQYILKALSLPEIYFVTPDREIQSPDFLNRCERILQSGCRMIQFRCLSDLSSGRKVLQQLLELCHQYNSRLILNATLDEAIKSGADGCHLSSRNLLNMSKQEVPDSFLTGASCHTLDELKKAEQLNIDYVVLGSVLETSSHPGEHGIGWDRFSVLIENISLPVYAIGGMQPGHLSRAWESGAHGIAAISSIWDLSMQSGTRLVDDSQCLIISDSS